MRGCAFSHIEIGFKARWAALAIIKSLVQRPKWVA